MHLAVFVVGLRILLQMVGDAFIVNDYGFAMRRRLLEEVDDIEQFACIASGISEKRRGLFYLDRALRQYLVVGERVVEQSLEFALFERFERIDLCA